MEESRKLNKEEIAYLLLSLTWGLPYTIIGAIIAIFIILFYRVFLGKKVKFTFNHKRLQVYIKDFLGGISLGMVYISYEEDKYDPVNIHELGHTVQAYLYGPFFIFLVAIPSLVRATFYSYFYQRYVKKKNKKGSVSLSSNDYYYSIWFERQATLLGIKII